MGTAWEMSGLRLTAAKRNILGSSLWRKVMDRFIRKFGPVILKKILLYKNVIHFLIIT